MSSPQLLQPPNAVHTESDLVRRSWTRQRRRLAVEVPYHRKYKKGVALATSHQQHRYSKLAVWNLQFAPYNRHPSQLARLLESSLAWKEPRREAKRDWWSSICGDKAGDVTCARLPIDPEADGVIDGISYPVTLCAF